MIPISVCSGHSLKWLLRRSVLAPRIYMACMTPIIPLLAELADGYEELPIPATIQTLAIYGTCTSPIYSEYVRV